VKDKAVHAVIFDKALQERLNKDVQSYRLKINGSLARKALNDLEAQGTIKKVVGHNTCNIYSTSTWAANTRISGTKLTPTLARTVTAE
jgi:small subunit ribosomal protein S25e